MAYDDILKNLKQTPPRSLNDHILIIDAMNMLIRSFSLLKAMNPDGHHIGGLVGFLRSLGYVTRIFDPTRVVVVWDGKGGSGNRKNIDPNYKAQRATSRITHWGLYDSIEQGIVAGNDPHIFLNTNGAQETSDDKIDPYSAGFTVVGSHGHVNASSGEYIFLAIA